MNRTTTALLAALEALIVVAIGVGIALVPLTILWATHFELAVDGTLFWQASANVWLLGNGVDLAVQLPAALAGPLGLPGAEAPFMITVALLGFAVLAVALGIRTGIRASETPHPIVGVLAAILSYGALAAVITVSAGRGAVTPAFAQGVVLPTLIYAAGVLAGACGVFGRGVSPADAAARSADVGNARSTAHTSRPNLLVGALGRGIAAIRSVPGGIRDRYNAAPPSWRLAVAEAARGGAAAATAVIGVAAIVVAVLIFANFATIIGLYETVQAGIMGGVTLTLAQLAFVPNLVIWAAAWLVGPGFALGAGTSATPFGTSLGAVPGLPIFGALPHGDLGAGFLGLLVPVLIGFLAARLIRRRSARLGQPVPTLSMALSTGGGIGAVAGLLLGLAAWASAGSMGPGRLVDVGPDPFLVGLVAAIEIGLAACLGMYAGIRAAERTEPETSDTDRT